MTKYFLFELEKFCQSKGTNKVFGVPNQIAVVATVLHTAKVIMELGDLTVVSDVRVCMQGYFTVYRSLLKYVIVRITTQK